MGVRCDVDIFKLTESAQPFNTEVYMVYIKQGNKMRLLIYQSLHLR